MWRGKEMKAVWERVGSLIYENAGQLLQSNCMWDQDYDVLLEEITKKDTIRKEREQKAKEEHERSQLQSAEGGWKALVDTFAQRNVPGVRVVPVKNDSFSVVLAKAGLAFKVHAHHTGQDGVPDFNISSKSSAEPPSKLEIAILDCLNSRSRKWDLTYLLVSLLGLLNFHNTHKSPGNDLVLFKYSNNLYQMRKIAGQSS